ncbi:MAG TPA: 30S ribosomal protein S6 [Bacteroidales bacterium]|nr:30S ribosomal protein S6 [Bacteroidales bacterium]
MVRHYETVFIMTPVLSDDQMKETVNKFQKFLIDKGAEIVYENNWGLRKLAYPVQKKSTGFYHLFEFKANGKLVAELEVAYKRDERILRFLTVALDRYAVAYALKKRSPKLPVEAVAEPLQSDDIKSETL